MKVMKKYISIIGCALGLLGLASCSNSEYDFDHLFPGEYHKMFYINNAADQGYIIYDVDEEHADTIQLFKAGSHPQLEADATFEQCNQKELDSLHKDYTILPANCYSLERTTHFAPNERYAKIPVKFDLAAVKAFLASQTDDKPVALSLKLVSDNATVNAEKMWFFRKITVEQPRVDFTPASINASFCDTELTITNQLSINNKWDFTCDLSTASAEADVAAYNTEHMTSYKLLPQTAYKLSASKLTFAKGTREVATKLTLDASSLSLNDTYLLPVRMANCSINGFNVSTSVLYVVVDPKVNITLDMLSSPCTQTDDGAALPGLIDNDPNTFWHSVWKTNYLNAEYGHYFQVDLKKTMRKQLYFDYYTRDYNSVCPTEIGIFVSTDGNTWKELVHLTKDGNNLPGTSSMWTSPVYDLPFDVNHVRFCIFRSNNGRTGVDNGACAAVTGFDLWGK